MNPFNDVVVLGKASTETLANSTPETVDDFSGGISQTRA